MRAGWKLGLFILIVSFLVIGRVAAQEGGDSERGAMLYQTYCQMCHGPDGQGRVGANLQDFPGIAVNAAIQQTITNGIEGSVMPAFGEVQGGPLSDMDVTDITAYVSGILAGTEPIAPAPVYEAPEIEPIPDISGDPSKGALVFQANCIACHGEEAQGGFGWPLAKNWPGNQPEVFINQVVSSGINGTIMPGWSQAVGGPLSGEEIEDVTAYVLTLEPASGLPETTEAPEGPLGATLSWILFGGVALILVVILVRYYQKA
jgi:cytochrome c oxidase cbb3-type subunit 3